MKKKQYKVYGIELKKVDTERFTLDAIFSTADEDRHGEIVTQNWELENFKNNPVILNSHNYGDATEVIGRAENVVVRDGKLQGSIVFAVNENPKAKIIFDLYAGGFLNAFSVGFMPLEFDKDFNILRSELLEISAVSVPANAMALAKEKGIAIDKLYGNKANVKSEDGDGQDAEPKGDGSEDKREEDNEEVVDTDGVQGGEANNEDADTNGKAVKAEGDECEMPDGSMGEMHPDESGTMVCVPKEKSVKRATKNEVLINFIESEKTKKRSILVNAKRILEEMLGGEEKVAEDSRKRKLNKVIRSLMEAK